MLGVYTLNEFLAQLNVHGNEINYVVSFPKIHAAKPDKGSVAIDFKLIPEYLVIRDDLHIQDMNNFEVIKKLCFESYLQRMAEKLLKE